VLTREQMLALFGELNDELCRSAIHGDVFIVGGAAMALAYDARPATRDKGFLPVTDYGVGRVVYENEYLTVSAPSPEYLLATKLLASRVSRDEDDILTLYKLCGFTTVDEGLDVLERYYEGRPIQAKVRFFLEELLAQ
jgi:hypothetical protein